MPAADYGEGPAAHTIVAPTYFYDNGLGGYSNILNGLLELPLPSDRPLQQLDRADRIELASDQPSRPVGRMRQTRYPNSTWTRFAEWAQHTFAPAAATFTSRRPATWHRYGVTP